LVLAVDELDDARDETILLALLKALRPISTDVRIAPI
jgi:hypothetical protein